MREGTCLPKHSFRALETAGKAPAYPPPHPPHTRCPWPLEVARTGRYFEASSNFGTLSFCFIIFISSMSLSYSSENP